MSAAWVLALAMVLDAALGEPDWLWRRLPHPAVVMGRALAWADRHVNRGRLRKQRGVAVVAALVLAAGLAGWGLSTIGWVIEVLAVAVLLAQRALVDHVRAVADGLRLSRDAGRRAVALIVSRDTRALDESAIARAGIESAAENLSDGVIAPAFWFLVAGLPGIMIYKMVNTADSMIGYRSPRYADFGWAAARLDDLLNWVPARLTALLIALPGGVLHHWSAIRADAALHRSPNAGWPEAAMARAGGVALAGPRAYDGVMQRFAWVHGAGTRTPGPPHIDAVVTCLWQAWGILLALAVGLGLLS